MNNYSSSLSTLRDHLLRAVDTEYNVIKPENVLEIISQLETMSITKDQLQTTRLGREINIIRQKINIKTNMSETTLALMIEIMQRAKKLLRTWKNLLTTVQTDSKPRLVLKLMKRKRDTHTHLDDTKRRKIDEIPIKKVLPRLKATAELLLQMQTRKPIVRIVPIEKDHRIASLLNLTFNSNETSTSISTLCASYTTVADLFIDHRRRIFAAHDTREIDARPDLLFPPIDQLAFVYQREQTEQASSSSSSLSPKPIQSSLTTIEKLDNLIALPFIDCPLEFDLILDELVISSPTF